jgi:hypothetical protein
VTGGKSETVHVLCDNGSVMLHDLPLPAGIADRVAKGQLRLVNADGTPLADPVPAPAVPDSDEVPTGSMAVVLGWVGESRERAARALEVEQAAEKPRKTLLTTLEALATEPDA